MDIENYFMDTTQKTMQIFVRLPTRTVTLNVYPSDTIAVVRQKLGEKWDAWPSNTKQPLLFNGQYLYDLNKTLSEYNIQKESTLLISMRYVEEDKHH